MGQIYRKARTKLAKVSLGVTSVRDDLEQIQRVLVFKRVGEMCRDSGRNVYDSLKSSTR